MIIVTDSREGFSFDLTRNKLTAGNADDGFDETEEELICKALTSQANEITCIITPAYGLLHDGYISSIVSK